MESESWSRFFSAASKRHQSSHLSRYGQASGTEPSPFSHFDFFPGSGSFDRALNEYLGHSDPYLDFEEIDGGGDSELRAEFACPFCADDFDIVGLCCHIDDEHPVEDKNVVCPVCATKVEMDLIGHITMQHGNLFKMQRRRRFRRGSAGSHSTLSLLKKELREANLQDLFPGLSHSTAPHSAAPDPLLSSLIYTLPFTDSSKDIQPESLDKGSVPRQSSEEIVIESSKPFLSEKEQEERARRSEFVQGLVLSTIFEEIL